MDVFERSMSVIEKRRTSGMRKLTVILVISFMVVSGFSILTYSTMGQGNGIGHALPVSGSSSMALLPQVPPLASSWTVSFKETGLPTSDAWNVTFNGVNGTSTTNYVNFTSIANGSYVFNVTVYPANYSPVPLTGTVNVAGANVGVSITFHEDFLVQFNQSTLPANERWNVTMGAGTSTSNGSNVSFLVFNGTYSFTVEPPSGWGSTPSTGSITVAGKNVYTVLDFYRIYVVSFNESGIPSGTKWSMGLGGSIESSTTSVIAYDEPNGTYSYNISSPPGYFPTPSSGSITVSGAEVNTPVVFTRNLTISVSPSPGYVDIGRTITFSNVTSGGSGGDVWSYSVNVSTGWTKSGNVFTFTSLGKYNVTLNVTDSDGHKASASSIVTVASDLTGVSVSGVPSVIDLGQTANLTATPAGGTTPYHYSWYTVSASGTVSAISGATDSFYIFNGSSFSGSVVTIGVKVTDNASTSPMMVYSLNFTISIFPKLTASISPTSGVTDVNTPIYFTASVFGGTGFCSYAWEVNGISQNDNTTTFTFESSQSGIFVVTFLVTDTHVSPQTIPYPNVYGIYATLTIHGAILAQISAVTDSLDQGQNVNIISNVSGGTGTYYYQWYMQGSSIAGATSSSYNFAPTSSFAPGNYSFYLAVKDNTGNYTVSNNVTIRVYPEMSLSVSPFPGNIARGQDANVTATIIGGSGGLVFLWYIQVPGSSSFVKNYTTENYFLVTKASMSYGTYSFYETVTDANGVSLKSNVVSITVGKGYGVKFAELGIPSGDSWFVKVNGNNSTSTGASLTFSLPNGTFSYVVTFIVAGSAGVRYVNFNATGNVTIGGSSVTVNVAFVTQYYVNFSISPAGGGSLSLVSTWYNATTKIDVLATPSGGFDFGSWSGTGTGSYSGSSDPAHIWANASITEAAYFLKLYTVTIDETGLPSGAIWYFNVSGLALQSGGPAISFLEPNGSYPFTVATGISYYVSPSSGTVSVDGKAVVLDVTFTGTIAITISPAKTSADVGRPITFTNSTLGGGGGYTWSYAVNATSGFMRTGNTFDFTKSGSYLVTITVHDGEGHVTSAASTITVYVDPTVSISGAPSIMDIGQNAPVTATVSGGASPYLYQWYVNNNLAGGNSPVLDFVPSGAGSYTIYVKITDSAFNYSMVSSASSDIVVNSPLVISINPLSGQVDAGLSLTLTGSASGGSSSYSFAWTVDGQVQSDTGESFIFTPTTAGTYTITFTVTDTGVSSSALPSPYTLKVVSVISVHSSFPVTLTAAHGGVDQGQYSNLTTQVSGGSGVFTYKWYENGNRLSFTKAFYNFSTSFATSPGSYVFYVEVTDSTGAIAYSSNVTVTVYSMMSVSVSASALSIGTGGYSNMTSRVTGGHGLLTYQWYEEFPGSSSYTQAGTGRYFNFSAVGGNLGNYSFYVIAKDGNNATTRSVVLTVNVSRGYEVTFTETGLPKGVSWSITMNGISTVSNKSSIKFLEPNVSYAYVILSPIAGASGIQYTTFYSAGILRVDGKAVNVTVVYVTQYRLTMNVAPANAGVVSPGSGWYNASSKVELSAFAGEYYSFDSWSGTGSGAYSGTAATPTVTMNGPVTELAGFARAYVITVSESGLPYGYPWFFNLSKTAYNSTSGYLMFMEVNGSYSYTVSSSVVGYKSSTVSGSFKVNGRDVNLTIDFTALTYSVYFNETGLQKGLSWSVALNGEEISGSSASLQFSEMNGSYSYAIGMVNGTSGVRYSVKESSGVVVVTGSKITVDVTFFVQYYLSVSVGAGSGMVSPGSGWYNSSAKVTLSVTATSGFAFLQWNGTGVGNYTGNASSASIVIPGPVTEVAFFGKLYSVQVTETGLAQGAMWYVNDTSIGLSVNSTSSTMNLTLVNGSYDYSLFGGYDYVQGVGVLNVSGQPVALAVVFSIKTYDVTVDVAGLPKGTSWSMTLSGTSVLGQPVSMTVSSTQGSATFKSVPMGTYHYSVSFPYGMSVSSKSSVRVNVEGVVVNVHTPPLVPIFPYLIPLIIVGGGGGAGAFFYFRRRKKQSVTLKEEKAE